MSTTIDNSPILLEEIFNKIDDYESTILAGLSFVSLVTWDKNHQLENYPIRIFHVKN